MNLSWKQVCQTHHSHQLLKQFDANYRYNETYSPLHQAWIRPACTVVYLSLAIATLLEVVARATVAFFTLPFYLIAIATKNPKWARQCVKIAYQTKFEPLLGKTSLFKVLLLIASSVLQLFDNLPIHYQTYSFELGQMNTIPSML